MNAQNAAEQDSLPGRIFAVVAGIFFFLVILKFGTPVILDDFVEAPATTSGIIFETWKIKWACFMVIPMVFAGMAAIDWRRLKFKWPLGLPVAWLGWQFVSATHTVNKNLTRLTLLHFSACVLLFYLGYFAMKQVRRPWPLWTGLALALCWIIHSAFEQHFGGLAATVNYMYKMMRENPAAITQAMLSPEYWRRATSMRVFATFSGPDELAGALELLTPLALVYLWTLTPKIRPAFRWCFVAIFGGCCLACLYWTVSKGGWLACLAMGLVAIAFSGLAKKLKVLLAFGAMAVVLAAFGYKYMGAAKKQTASVVTRSAYWKAAAKITETHPVFGAGPGTFSIAYTQVKSAGDDFTKLCHNDYLEQFSDAGIPSGLLYLAWIFGFIYLYRYRSDEKKKNLYFFALWLGILGFCLHSAVDYLLYVPALAWPMFFFLGYQCQISRLTLK